MLIIRLFVVLMILGYPDKLKKEMVKSLIYVISVGLVIIRVDF
jgi:hypothetical protein